MKKYRVNVNGTVYEVELEEMPGAPGVPAAPAISPRHSAPRRSSCGWPVKAPSAPKARTPSR